MTCNLIMSDLAQKGITPILNRKRRIVVRIFEYLFSNGNDKKNYYLVGKSIKRNSFSMQKIIHTLFMIFASFI